MQVNKEKIRCIYSFPLIKAKSQSIKIVNGAYGVDSVIINYGYFWFRQLRSGIFDVKENVDNVDKITEIIEVDRPRAKECPVLKDLGKNFTQK